MSRVRPPVVPLVAEIVGAVRFTSGGTSEQAAMIVPGDFISSRRNAEVGKRMLQGLLRELLDPKSPSSGPLVAVLRRLSPALGVVGLLLGVRRIRSRPLCIGEVVGLVVLGLRIQTVRFRLTPVGFVQVGRVHARDIAVKPGKQRLGC